jgi:hypothetical protein
MNRICPMPANQSNIPHRKNAAEWLMFITLYPIAWLARRLQK